MEKDSYIYNYTLLKDNNYNNVNYINFKIGINCLDIGKKFNNILDKNPFRVILTSATLYPFNLFEMTLNHKFGINFQNNHFIENNQLIFKLITNYKLIGDTNKEFYFIRSLDKSELEKQYKILGKLLLDLSKITPDGILMFFTSITVLDNCVNVWKEENIYDKINDNKKIIIDNKKMKLKQNMLEDNYIINNIYNYDNISENDFSPISYINPLLLYKKSIDEGNGGIILSFFKGKIGQKINFKGKYGRMVINVGIPFIDKNSEKYKLKKEYCYKNGKYFNEWQRGDALLKMNNSCGRIIRYKNDYCMPIAYNAEAIGDVVEAFNNADEVDIDCYSEMIIFFKFYILFSFVLLF